MSKAKELKSNDQKLLDIRLVAEKHWLYTEGLIKTSLEAVGDQFTKGSLEMMHYLYVEAFIHGYKHRLEEDGIIK